MILALNSCSKSDDNNVAIFDETCTELTFNGLSISIDGDIAPLMTPGSAIYNNYIECIQNCAETDPNDPNCMMDCLNSSGMVPSGGAFTIVLYLTNTTGSDITITINPGTWFFTGSGDYQPMVIAVSVTITITAGQTVTKPIPVFCLASDKSAPDESSEYTICDIVSLSCLTDIIDVLQTKDISAIGFVEAMNIQAIIWDCTEGEPVDMEYLNALP